MTTSVSLERAVGRCLEWLLGRDAPEAALAAHESGRASSDSAARGWIRAILDEQDGEGSWAGDLLRTAEALDAMEDLRSAAGIGEIDPGIGLGLDWIRDRRGQPGSWADGCSPERHDLGLCHHYVGGAIAAAPPEVVCGEARLRSGARVQGDMEVRLVASATALRSLLAHGPAGRDDRLHLDSLRRVVGAWGRQGPLGFGTAALLSSVHALVSADRGVEADREAVDRGLRIVSGRQRGDGSWVDADAFQALEVLGAIVDRGMVPDAARRALWHGARLLIATQQGDGSWGESYGERRALIAWRTFRRVQT
jgi:hypothetical protein